MSTPPFLLASESPRRRLLLEALSLPFRVVPSGAEERSPPHGDAVALARDNARLKAEEVARHHPDHWVLGADTVVTRAGRIYGKPTDPDQARDMLRELQGATHEVVTGMCLRCGGRDRSEIWHDTTRVSFRSLSPAAIDRYLEGIDPLDKAGAYAIQEGGEFIVGRIEGSLSNVVGLSLESLEARLRSLGLS